MLPPGHAHAYAVATTDTPLDSRPLSTAQHPATLFCRRTPRPRVASLPGGVGPNFTLCTAGLLSQAAPRTLSTTSGPRPSPLARCAALAVVVLVQVIVASRPWSTACLPCPLNRLAQPGGKDGTWVCTEHHRAPPHTTAHHSTPAATLSSCHRPPSTPTHDATSNCCLRGLDQPGPPWPPSRVPLQSLQYGYTRPGSG